VWVQFATNCRWLFLHPASLSLQLQGAGKGKRIMAGNGSGVPPMAAEADGVAASQHAAPSGVVLPLDPSTQVNCLHRDGTYRLVRIVDRRPRSGTTDEYEYYVHYRKLNRRMDEWVPAANLDLSTVVLPQLEEPAPGDKSKKRKVVDDHSEEEGHDEFDEKQLRVMITKLTTFILKLCRYLSGT
jgi:hypothetical protein